jgi:L-lactate dehydrogenase
VAQIVQALVRDQRRVLTVSSLTQGEYGLPEVCLSLPRVVGRQGVERTLVMALTESEQQQLHRSAQILRQVIDSIQW